MLTYDMSERGGLPLYEYLCRRIRADILSGVLAAGEQLPSRRALAQHLGVSMVTVDTAYGQLVDEGYLRAAPRRGYFVAQVQAVPETPHPPVALPQPETPVWMDLVSNHTPEALFPFSIWARLTRTVISERGAQLLSPVPYHGVPELRQAIAAHLRRFRGLDADPACIVVGAGAEYLYPMVVQFLGRDRRYGVENPGYGKIARIYAQNGADIVYLGMDREGVRMDALEQSGAQVVHLSPSHHFPTGIVTTMARRQALLRWAQAAPDRYILEDDYDSEFRFTGKPLRPLQSLDGAGRTLYLNTFSKTISPAFRISYLVLPRALAAEYGARMAFYASPVPALDQYVLAQFLDGGYFERHIGRMKRAYRVRRDAVIAAIKASGLRGEIQEAGAGLHFLLRLDTAVPDAVLRQAALEKGIRISFLSEYYHGGGMAEEHLVLFNYTGVDLARLPQALEQLAALQ